jgi:predicted O-methyltransferase YrrM
VPDGVQFWNMPSDQFFSEYTEEPADVIFIDGDHSEEQAARDFMNAVKILAPRGVIALHDTYPWRRLGDVPQTHLCGDVYKVAAAIKDSGFYGVVTIPRFPGVTLVTVNGN